tara:strand:- start:124 stop:318 length:195 start_codon:yes stop_codon:yes gene_type:complete
MEHTKKIKVGDSVNWKLSMHESFIFQRATVVKIFKNGKAKIQFLNRWGEGDICFASVKMDSLIK